MSGDTGALKADYFDGRVSPADAMLAEGKRRGIVPQTCLLGGYMVMAAAAMNADPCAQCDGPRERCGGRPKDAGAAARPGAWPENVRERRTVDTPEVRAAVRSVVVDGLRALTQEALAEKEGKDG